METTGREAALVGTLDVVVSGLVAGDVPEVLPRAAGSRVGIETRLMASRTGRVMTC